MKSGPNTKPIAGLLARDGKSPGKCSSKDAAASTKDRPGLLTRLLPKTLVEIVIGYLNDEKYSIFVFALTWSLTGIPRIAVDSVRVYVMTDSQGLKGLVHSPASSTKDVQCMELGNPQWSKYYQLGSSHDGRYISFSHFDKAAVHLGGPTRRNTKWLAQSSGPMDGGFGRIAFDGEGFAYGLLSRDGKARFLTAAERMTLHTFTRSRKRREGSRACPRNLSSAAHLVLSAANATASWSRMQDGLKYTTLARAQQAGGFAKSKPAPYPPMR